MISTQQKDVLLKECTRNRFYLRRGHNTSNENQIIVTHNQMLSVVYKLLVCRFLINGLNSNFNVLKTVIGMSL